MEFSDLIMQKVQSFLSDEDALKSCTLSKAWFHSYSTHPVLKFVHTRFRGGDAKFVTAVNDALVRYRQHNLRIQSLELVLEQRTPTVVSHVNGWVERAIEHCELEKLSLVFFPFNDYELPLKFFNARTLRELRIVHCRIQKLLSSPMDAVSCCLVTHLDLKDVVVTQTVLDHLLHSCRFIETLLLYDCSGFKKVKIGRANLRRLKEFRIRVRSPTVVKVSGISLVSYYNPCARLQRIPSTFRFDASRNLTNLELSSGIITDTSLTELLLRLPFLTSLVLNHCDSLEEIDVTHGSLNSFNVSFCVKLVEVDIDCPKLKSLTYGGFITMPVIVMNQAKVEMTLDLWCPQDLDDSWFLRLCNILLDLNHCHRLSIKVASDTDVNICSNNLRGLRIARLAIVENVFLDIQQSTTTICVIMEAIHCICCPMNMMVKQQVE